MRYLRYIKYGYIYIYGINMEADDESIFYKYDAKATKYGDLLFFFGRRVLCLLARGP
jgi:hypothetical protein